MACRLLFDSSPLPTVAVAGARHIVCYVNPAFCGLSAKSDDKLIGNPFAEIVMEEGILSILERVYRTGKAETYTEPETSVVKTEYWSYTIGRFREQMRAHWEP